MAFRFPIPPKLLLISVGVGLALGIGLFGLYQSRTPQNTIKKIIEHEFSKVLHQHVTIDSISGNLISSTTLHGIHIYNPKGFKKETAIYIKELTAYYQLVNGVRFKGDFAKASSLIEIKGVDVLVQRNSNNLWNMLNLLPIVPNPQPPTFRGKILIEDMTVRLEDDHGWHDETPVFKTKFTHLSGLLDFTDYKKVKTYFVGLHRDRTKEPLRLWGMFNCMNGQFLLRYSALDFSLPEWGPYIFSSRTLMFKKGNASLTGIIQSKPVAHVMPFWTTLKLKLSNVTLKTPFLKSPIQQANARITIQHSRPKESPIFIKFESASGYIDHFPVSLRGKINLSSGTVDLTAQTSTVSLDQLSKAVLENPLPLSGTAAFTLNINGPLQAPTLMGHLKHGNITLQKNLVHEVDLSFSYTIGKPKVAFSVAHARTFDTHFSGKGHLTMPSKQSPLSYKASLTTESKPIQVWAPELKPYAKGALSLQFEVEGSANQTDFICTVVPKNVCIFNQSLLGVTIHGALSNGHTMALLPSQIWINSHTTPLVVTGFLNGENSLSLTLSGVQVPFSDPFGSTPQSQGWITVQSTVTLPFKSIPLDDVLKETTGTLAVTSYGIWINEFPINSLTASVKVDKGIIQIDRFGINTQDQSIAVTGQLVNSTPVRLTIDLHQIEITKNKFYSKLLPAQLQTLSGFLNGHIQIQKINSEPLNKKLPWFHQYTLEGQGEVLNGILLNQPFDKVALIGKWDGKTCLIKDASVNNLSSFLALEGSIFEDHSIDFKFKPGCHISLLDFEPLLAQFGYLEGDISFSGSLKGFIQNPEMTLDLSATHLKTQYLKFDTLQGKVAYKDGLIKMNPLSFSKDNYGYQLEGSLNISKVFHRPNFKFQDLDYSLMVTLKNVRLDSFSSILENIIKEIRSRILSQDQIVMRQQVTNSNIQTRIETPNQDPTKQVLYLAGATSHALSFYEKIKADIQHKDFEDLGLSEFLEGDISGAIFIQSRPNQFPLIKGSLSLAKLESFMLKAEKVEAKFQTQGQSTGVQLLLKNGILGQKSFSEFKLNSVISESSVLSILSSELVTEDQTNTNFIKGKIPFLPESTPEKLDLHVSLLNNDIGLLTFMSPLLGSITNQGEIKLHLTGSIQAPLISIEKAALSHATISFNDSPIISPFLIEKAVLSMKDNVLSLENLNWKWAGKDTQLNGTTHTNTFSLKGEVTLQNFTLLNPKNMQLKLNLSLDPTLLAIHFPQIYSGYVSLSPLTLKGIYTFPFSPNEKNAATIRYIKNLETGPLLSGDVSLHSGEISMPTLGPKKVRPTILFGIDCHIKQDVSVEGSLIDQGFLNTFDLLLAPTESPLQIRGTWNYPKFLTPLSFSEGSVTVFNRTFSLLPATKQRIFFTSQPYKVKSNKLSFVFQETEQTFRNIPNLEIAAMTSIDPDAPKSTNSTDTTLTDTTDPEASKYKFILVLINGPIYSLNSFTFEKYLSATDTPLDQQVSFVNAINLGDGNGQKLNRLAEMLVPDIYESTVAKKGLDSTKIINQIGESQLNTALRKQIRPIEKNIAKNVGLYDLKVDYNVGGALLKATRIQGLGSDSQNLGVNAIKDLVKDKLFLRVKTILDVQSKQTNSNQSFQVSEMELTYLLLQNLSFNFSEIRDSTTQETRPKMSVKYSHEF